MPILYDNYLIVPHKDLHGVFDASAKKKPVAMRHALDLAKKTNKIILEAWRRAFPGKPVPKEALDMLKPYYKDIDLDVHSG